MLEVWIPEKREIENIFESMFNKLRRAETVSDVEDWLLDEMPVLECHISNRSNVERGKIKA